MNNNIITWYPGPRAPRPLPARGGGARPPAAGLARDRGHAHDGEALVTGVGGAVLAVEIYGPGSWFPAAVTSITITWKCLPV